MRSRPWPRDTRAVTSAVGTILVVMLTVVLAGTIGLYTIGLADDIDERQDPRAFVDNQVILGPEHRTWGGWDDGAGGDPERGDIDIVRLTYANGPVFRGDEIGSIVVRWSGPDGEGGQVRFLNPDGFDEDTEQIYHPGATIGEFCTGDLHVGETLTIRMVHNRYQSGGQTDAGPGEPFRYVGSNQNDIATGDDNPFFRVDGRYPITSSGDRPIDPGDTVEVVFFGTENEQPIARTTTTATEFTGNPSPRDRPDC
jgi:hypothetical protein